MTVSNLNDAVSVDTWIEKERLLEKTLCYKRGYVYKYINK